MLALLAAPQVFGFSFYGPIESWQTTEKNHVDRWFYGAVLRAESDASFAFFSVGPGGLGYGGTTDLGGSKNLGDEYRLNTPSITYAIDASFYDYFGANGAKAIDQAMAVLNRLPPVSRTSADLSEFLTEGNQRVNQRAQALQLIDLKSTVLHIMVERMGLFGETHVFDLHDRVAYPGTCNFDYATVIRNFDPVTWEPTRFVNGTLYTYNIADLCPAFAEADAIERIGNTTAFQFTAVATQEGLIYGGYYLNITRDDMGGLRYLYRANNFNNESLPPDAVASTTTSPWTPVGGTTTNAFRTNTLALRGGIEKITFVKTQFDSQFGVGWTPRTVRYSVPIVTNSHLIYQPVQRRLTQPDIVFRAADLTAGGFNSTYRRSSQVVISNNVPNSSGAGPGAFLPQATITFNKAGQVILNATPFFLDEVTSSTSFQWGSFDGSTNAPIVYPSGTSISEIESAVLNSRLNPPPDTSGTYNPLF
ncbi:MAG: hypothetical protein JWO95_3390 [Verrucomicrobiales bacterium]|nr:hypothetical protein [Verrucomicrobiales bacterium]